MIAISGPVRGRIGTDLIDLQGSGRLLGRGIDAAAGEHVRANFSLHRRAGYEKKSEATDVATMIFRGGKRDIRASVLISMERRDAGPPTTSQRTPAFVESGL